MASKSRQTFTGEDRVHCNASQEACQSTHMYVDKNTILPTYCNYMYKVYLAYSSSFFTNSCLALYQSKLSQNNGHGVQLPSSSTACSMLTTLWLPEPSPSLLLGPPTQTVDMSSLSRPGTSNKQQNVSC